MTTTDPTLDQTLDLARRLSRNDRAQLITILVNELANIQLLASPAASSNESPLHTNIGSAEWDHLFTIMDRVSALPRSGTLSALEDLTQGRR